MNESIKIYKHKLPFQNKNLAPYTIKRHFSEYLAELTNCIIVATDASKDNNKTSIVAVNVSYSNSTSNMIKNMNLVFTAETLSINTYINTNNKYNVFYGGKSVLNALIRVNYNYHAS